MVTMGNVLTVNSHGALDCIMAWQGGVLASVLWLDKVVYWLAYHPTGLTLIFCV